MILCQNDSPLISIALRYRNFLPGGMGMSKGPVIDDIRAGEHLATVYLMPNPGFTGNSSA